MPTVRPSPSRVPERSSPWAQVPTVPSTSRSITEALPPSRENGKIGCKIIKWSTQGMRFLPNDYIKWLIFLEDDRRKALTEEITNNLLLQYGLHEATIL
ncbi:hypothetical protein HBH98_172490 [Parastagonospora nodorum]|nr:hypothetical protein HBH53_245190 [Parastagonospora nodorum]KAH3961653.1 hypothetical protein HBH51_180250 [Parastagonospora nodorum]KAH3968349.1 hypothetical protein HBH52_180710 [Parastagonospora nodorum]KAH3991331.1 hypothetical protein HBI10_235440 [Parastagonospora nodorum]KAH4008865.1 hypothetical protein HBI13_227410 [Parastagonospora nodorum]